MPAVRKLTFTEILYRTLGLATLLAGLVFLPRASVGQEQEDKPSIPPQEWKVSKKKEQGPRALALLRISSNGKATLVPIAIRMDGKFYDAAAYKANPVPMALDSGTVYEGERSGTSAGLFTVNGALHSLAASNPDPWIGTGVWLPAGAEAPKTSLKAETVPVGIESADGPPRLTKSGSTPAGGSKTDTASGPKAGSSPSDANPPKPEPQKSPSDSKPVDRSEGASGSPSGRAGDDTNRPRLRRGKPTEPLPADEDVPGYGKPKTGGTDAKSDPATGAKTSETAVSWKAVQLIPAISDAGGPDPRSYVYEGIKADEEDRNKQMLAMAREQLLAYLAKLAKGKVETAPAKSKAARRPAAKTPQPVIENVQVRAFDLWKNNQPVLVLSAEAHIPPSATGETSAETFAAYTITVVARIDMYSNLHKLYSGVTDKYHLDVTPRLELIDAVDADGDGRGELLFRKTTDSGSGYVIYRATADTLWKMFDTLSPE